MVAAVDSELRFEELKSVNSDVALELKAASKQTYIACNIDLIYTSFLDVGNSPE
jgi:hypothetical protein